MPSCILPLPKPGTQFGRLTATGVIKKADGLNRHTFAECYCSCGAAPRFYRLDSLLNATTKSCGCFNRDRPRGTHGKTRTPEYVAWQGIKTRCLNPQSKFYGYYGARGIKICQEWASSFEAFFSYVGPRPTPKHTIDRYPNNNNGNYEPGNVRWATRTEQARNTRATRMLEINGETLCITEWAERTGIQENTIRSRLRAGVAPQC